MQLEGSIQLSGDKSISHRLLMYAAITKGKAYCIIFLFAMMFFQLSKF